MEGMGVMDRPMVFGLAGTLVLLVGVMVAGAGWEAGVFWQTPSVIWVLGGVALTTLTAFPAGGWRAVRALVRNALFVQHRRPDDLVAVLVALAHTARRYGLLALERPAASLRDEYVSRPLRMAIDGMDPNVIAGIMRAELEAVDLRHTYGVRMLETAARSAPVFGMVGTLIGLVLMLGRMNDPAAIGPGMAVALLTTLYGLVLAHVFCLPVARRLAHRNSEELLFRTIALEGVLAIQAGDTPRIVEQKLRAYLPTDGWTPMAESLLGTSVHADRGGVARAAAARRSSGVNGKGEVPREARAEDRPEAFSGGKDSLGALTGEALERLLVQRRQTVAKDADRRMPKRSSSARSSIRTGV